MTDARLTLSGSDVLLRPRPLGKRAPEFRSAVSAGRQLGRAWVLDVGRTHGVLKRLRDAGFSVEIEDALAHRLREIEAAIWLDLQAIEPRLAFAEKELAKEGKSLRPYQREGTRWLASRPCGGLLADFPGAGKSVQTLASLPADAPVLIIAPAKVKGEWVRHVRLWRPNLKAVIANGRDGFRMPKRGEVVIANYDILPLVHKESCPRVVEKKCPGCSPYYKGAHKPGCDRFRKVCAGCTEMPTPLEGTFLIIDEVHMAKSPKAQRTEAVRAIGERIVQAGGRRFGLTGTPLMNRPDELWHVLDSLGLAHEAFGTWRDFMEVFDARPRVVVDKKTKKRTTRGLEWGTPKPEATERLARVMLRRLQSDVLQDLPEKTYKLVPVEVDRKALAAADELLEAIQGMGGMKNLAELLTKKKLPFELISAARAALATAKIPAMLEMVEEYEENETPLVVFSAHRAPVDLLGDREGWSVISGGSKEDPAETIRAFQDETRPVRGIACTIGAAGTGITLTRASHMLFVDQAWNPAINEQAEARCLRLGQKNAVLVNVLVADHPLDERLAELLIEKKHLFTTVVDGAAVRK